MIAPGASARHDRRCTEPDRTIDRPEGRHARRLEGDIVLVEGVPEGYDPTATAEAMRRALPAEPAE
ncbi:hypothetical protein QFZ74_004808 [Streptomyces sp. V3I7]|nr:hypothetical protein [Streptomyces sp. V3I7]